MPRPAAASSVSAAPVKDDSTSCSAASSRSASAPHSQSSCPGLSRASTPSLYLGLQRRGWPEKIPPRHRWWMATPEFSMKRSFFSLCLAALALSLAPIQAAEQREPYGIGLEGYAYPYPV